MTLTAGAHTSQPPRESKATHFRMYLRTLRINGVRRLNEPPKLRHVQLQRHIQTGVCPNSPNRSSRISMIMSERGIA